MKFVVLCFILCFGARAFSQSNDSRNYYQSSNNKYIVEIRDQLAYVYRSKVSPDRISIYEIDTLTNVLSDSSSGEQLTLFYSNNWFSVEKRGQAYFLVKTKANQKPGKAFDLNPIMDRMEIEKAINVYQCEYFYSERLKDLDNEFPDYDGSWRSVSLDKAFYSISTELPREQYLYELNKGEAAFYDSIRNLNEKYKQLIDRIGEDSVSLEEATAFYNEIRSKEYDFMGYQYHFINKLIDHEPELYFGVAGSIESTSEREAYYLAMNNSRYRKLKATEADADLKAEFRRVYRNNTISNISWYILESVAVLIASWLVSI